MRELNDEELELTTELEEALRKLIRMYLKNPGRFQAAVLKEKRCETVNEGQRWFDLARTGNLETFVKRAKGDKANPQAHNYVFPIPQREIDLNDALEQNDQY